MYTSSEHIIIHFQIINGKNYIRIITVLNTDDYIQEIKTVYDQNISINDGSISVFYNCGELYDRLISDLGFKKFNGVSKITKILNGLWQIDQNEGTIDIMGWYINTYIAWIKSRLNMYIEDLDDDQYFYPWDVKWCDFAVNNYVKIQYLEDLKNTNYKLQDCEKTKEGNFIFTRNHFLALISHYINNNYGKVLSPFDKDTNVKLPTEVDETVEKSTLIINKCNYLRGLTLDKNVLSTIDVEEIFKFLFIPNMVFGSIAKSKDFISTYQDDITNQFNNLCESNLFGGFYSFLDESKGLQPSCQGDLNNVYSILEKDTYETSTSPRDLPPPVIAGPAKPRSIINIDSSNFMNDLIKKAVPATLANIMLFGPMQTENNIVQPIEQTKMLFKNLITNVVHAYDTNIKLLKELELLSSYTYKNEFTSKVIESLEEISLSRPLINELKELISILDNVTGNDDEDIDKTSNNKTSEFNIQKLLTDSYVKTYKNDKAETVASTVIDNVYNYLSPLKQINRNQIGKDLVDLGVKKTRKAKGFVYGIEDTNHVEKKPMTSSDLLPREGLWCDLKTVPKELTVTFSDFKIDESKVIKNNKQIRSEPPVVVDNQLFKFSAPSKFLDKVSKEHSQSLPKDQIGW